MITGVRAFVVIAVAVMVLTAAARAEAPANDRFATAQVLTGDSGSITGTNVGATAEVGEPIPSGGGRASVWYRWSATFSGILLVETCDSPFDTVVAVYAGEALGTIVELGANDDSCDLQSRVAVRVVAGTVYHVLVSGSGNRSGTFTLRWRPVQPPANDEVAGAELLAGASGEIAGTNVGATREAREPTHGPGSGSSVWYRWTAPFSGTATVDTCESSFNTVLRAYTGDPLEDLTVIATGEDECNENRSRIVFVTPAQREYWIVVDGEAGSVGDIALSWAIRRPPANDNFARARSLPGASGRVTGTNAAATRERGEPNHGGRAGSVWYRWRAPRTMAAGFSTCNAGFDTVLAVYRGPNVSSLRLVDSDDDSCPNDTGSVVGIRARRGAVYQIAVGGFGTGGTFRLLWGPPRIGLLCRTPALRGLTLREARKALAGADCSLGRVHHVGSFIVPRGRVVSQYPEPETRLPFDSAVNVEVSSGPGR